MKIKIFVVSIFLFVFSSCEKDISDVDPTTKSNYLTKNVVVVVIDGPRYIDSWNNSHVDNVPSQRKLIQEGVFFNNFYNDGATYTVSGHTAICTGYYEQMENGGKELPSNPSFFQQFLSQTNLPPQKSFLITSKEKLRVLGNSKNIYWKNRYSPAIDAFDRDDSLTYKKSIQILNNQKPILSLIHFKGPDYFGHQHNWVKYIKSIQEADRYVDSIWQFLQNNNHYKDKTTLLVTSDHGRHLDEIGSGFFDHGDRCDGCKHIYLLALGPDFEKGKIVSRYYGQIDIAPTIATLLNFNFKSEGDQIDELTKNNLR